MAEKKETQQYGPASVQRQGNSFTQTGRTGINQSTASPRMNPQQAEQIRNFIAHPFRSIGQALGGATNAATDAATVIGQKTEAIGQAAGDAGRGIAEGFLQARPGNIQEFRRQAGIGGLPQSPTAFDTSIAGQITGAERPGQMSMIGIYGAPPGRGPADARQPQGGGQLPQGWSREIAYPNATQERVRYDNGAGGYMEGMRPQMSQGGTFSVVGDGGSRFGLTPEQWNGLSQEEATALRVKGINQDIAALQDLSATRRQAAGLGPQQGQQGRNQGQGLAGPQGYDWGGELQDFLSGRPRSDNMFSNLTRMIEGATATTADGVRVHTAESKALQTMLGQMMAGIGGGIEDEMGMRGRIDPQIAMMQDRMNADWQKQLMDEAYRRDKLTQEGYQADRSAWLDYAKAMQPKGLSTVDMPMYDSQGTVVGTQPAGAYFDPRAGWQVQPLGMSGPDIFED